ncbi:hypothetical protein D3H55_16145 [Bacillus salacetis]|uniref:Uncharacterized protein n=1 Tax=Bacillus salacetis TaxID=2315464 RepID=A0A3A1QZ00_9BACI|nr:hypothetical protein [Bacillus salacetis]RIW30915.1 hypothetical protein D3H55_16145 [Bacillus salacetis]
MFIRDLQTGISHSWTSGNFYKELKANANNTVYEKLIAKAENDKYKHYELLQYAYFLQVGEYHSFKKEERTAATFREGVLGALKEELKSAVFYRDLLMDFPGWQIYKPLFTVMADAPVNAVRFSYIYKEIK